MGRRKKEFWKTAMYNNAEFLLYANKFTELALSMFEWKNLPDTVDARFLELTLFNNGQAVFFYDDVLGYLALQNIATAPLNVYNIPIKRRAYATSGFQKELTEKDSVIIFNNMLHEPTAPQMMVYASRLWDIDKTIDVNCHAQKTPILITCEEQQRLTLENAYQQIDGNTPVIFADKGLNPRSISSISTGAPFVAKDLYQIRCDIWSEALTYLGIVNNSLAKKERLITMEVENSNGDTYANRFSRLYERQEACKKINEMFGLDISCEFRNDVFIPAEKVDSILNVERIAQPVVDKLKGGSDE